MFFNQNDRDSKGFKALRWCLTRAKVWDRCTEIDEEVGEYIETKATFEGVLNIHQLQAIKSLHDLGYRGYGSSFTVSIHFYDRDKLTETTVFCEFPGNKGSRKIVVYLTKYQFSDREKSAKLFDSLEKKDLTIAQKFAVYLAKQEMQQTGRVTLNSTLDTIDGMFFFELVQDTRFKLIDPDTLKALLRAREELRDGQFELNDRLSRFNLTDLAIALRL